MAGLKKVVVGVAKSILHTEAKMSSSPNDSAQFTLNQLTLPNKSSLAKSVPLLIPDNSSYNPKESTLHFKPGQLHSMIAQKQLFTSKLCNMVIALCKVIILCINFNFDVATCTAC